MAKKVKKVIHRKLGKHKALGLAYCETGIIHIDERLKGKEHLYVCVHEILHIQNPTWEEEQIIKHSEETSNLLWELGYRRAELTES